jgi:hypothetical protein
VTAYAGIEEGLFPTSEVTKGVDFVPCCEWCGKHGDGIHLDDVRDKWHEPIMWALLAIDEHKKTCEKRPTTGGTA